MLPYQRIEHKRTPQQTDEMEFSLRPAYTRLGRANKRHPPTILASPMKYICRMCSCPRFTITRTKARKSGWQAADLG